MVRVVEQKYLKANSSPSRSKEIGGDPSTFSLTLLHKKSAEKKIEYEYVGAVKSVASSDQVRCKTAKVSDFDR